MSDKQRKGRPSSRGGSHPGSGSRRRPRTPRANPVPPEAKRVSPEARGDNAASARQASSRATGQRQPTDSGRNGRPAAAQATREAGQSQPKAKTPRSAAAAPSPRSDLNARLRRFGLVSAATDGVAVLAIITLAILFVTITDVGLTPFPASVASAWMVLNMSPVIVNGVTLGVVPAVPAMLFVGVVAWRIRREVSGPISVRDIRVLSAFTLVTPVILTSIAWLMLWDASRSTLIDVDTPSFFSALLATLLLRLIALAVGIGPKLLTALLRRRGLPEWPVESLRLGADIVVCLWAAAAIVVLLAGLIRFGAVGEAYSVTAGAGGVIGMTIMSLLYLPNAAAATIGVLTGASANVGVAEVGLFGVIPGSLPPLPLLGGMPQEHHVWFAVLLVVPVGVVMWRVYRYLFTSASENAYYVVVVAAIVAGVLVAAVAWMTSGELGYFGETGTPWSLVGVLASVWVALPAALTVVVVRGFPEVFGRDNDKVALDDASVAHDPISDIDDEHEEDDYEEPEDTDLEEVDPEDPELEVDDEFDEEPEEPEEPEEVEEVEEPGEDPELAEGHEADTVDEGADDEDGDVGKQSLEEEGDGDVPRNPGSGD